MAFRTKVSLLFAGFPALIVVSFSVAIFGVAKPTIIRSIDNSLEDISSKVLSNILVIPLRAPDSAKVEVLIRSDDMLRMRGFSLQVWQTSDGDSPIDPLLIAASLDLADVESALDASRLILDRAQYSDVSTGPTLGDTLLRVLTRPYSTVEGKQIGVVQIASAASIVEDVTDGILGIVLWVTVIGVIVAIFLGLAVSYRALRPIQKMTAAAAQISTSTDLTTRLPTVLPNDEIGKLTRAFNHMMARLEQLFGIQQRFVANLSHELRTPLTTIQGNLDLLKRYGSDEAALEAIEGETKRMTRMVNEVLLLARVDSGDIAVDLRPLDIDALVLETFDRIFALPDVKDRELNIKLDTQQSVCIHGDYERLQLLVQHLIANAIRFTPDGGTVTVSLRSQEHRFAILEVEDSGIGIGNENLARIFDRFFQADGSRRHLNDTDGAGLGLPIVKWIADVHSGSVEVESKPEQGSLFRVVLPLHKHN